jgi:hypothetical protein
MKKEDNGVKSEEGCTRVNKHREDWWRKVEREKSRKELCIEDAWKEWVLRFQ